MKKLYLALIFFITITTSINVAATTLTNNYNSATGSITFNGSSGSLGTVSSLAAWASTTIPTGTTSILLNNLGGISNQFNIVIANVTAVDDNINIYYSETLTNTTQFVILVNNYTVNQTFPTGGYAMSAGQVLPIVSGTNQMTVLYNNQQVASNYTTSILGISPVSITYSGGKFNIQLYFDQLTNNYSQAATNVIYHNNNPTISNNIISTLATIAAGSPAIIPSSTAYTTLDTTFSNGTTQVSSTLTINNTITATSPSSTIFASGTMTNNTTSAVTVTYCGTVNGVANQSLNTPVITIPVQGAIPNIKGSSLINVYAANGTTSIVSDYPITDSTSYYINSDGIGTTPVNPVTGTLTNNYNQIISRLRFFSDLSGTLISETSLGAWSSTTIPSNTVKMTALTPLGLITWTTVPSGVSADIYTTAIFTNDTTSALTLRFSGTGTLGNLTTTLTLPAGASYPIITGTTSVVVDTTSADVTASIAANTSYIVTGSDPSYIVTAYTPTLTNNYSLTASNVNYYDSQGTFISSPVNGTIAAKSYANIPGDAYTVKLTELASTTSGIDSTITLPINFPYENIFTGWTVTNNSGQAIGISYTGTVSGVQGASLNTPEILISSAQTSPIITGASNISAVDSDGIEIANITGYQIQSGTSYYITFTNGIWYISSSAVLAQLLNNSNMSVTDVKFKDASDNQVSETISILLAGAHATIPTGAVYCTFTIILNGTPANLKVAVSDLADSNIFGSTVLTNSSGSDNVTVNYTGTINGTIGTLLNTTPIPLLNGQSIPFITNTTGVYVFDSASPVVSSTSILQDTPYFIHNTSGTWTIDSSATIITLLNNYTTSITNLTLTNSSGGIVGGPVAFPAGAYSEIFTDAVVATMTNTIPTAGETPTTMYVPVLDSISSDLFTGTITNNALTTVSVSYFGTLNSMADSLLNTTQITIPLTSPGPKIPIITGATTVTVYSDSVEVLSDEAISGGNYFINENTVDGVTQWSFDTFAANYVLTNNFNQPISAISFYNNGTFISTSHPVAAWGHTQIPTTATSASFDYTFNGVTVTCTIPVFGATTSSNIFENYVLTNTYAATINVTLYGTIDSVSNQPFNASSISIPINGFIPIFANTTQVSATSTPDAPLIPTDITSTSSYTITDGSGTLIITAFTPMLINNGKENASNLTFIQSNSATISSTATPSGYYALFDVTDSVEVPGNATFATLTDFNSTLTIATSFDATSDLFTGQTITNNAQQTININFYGTINGVDDQLLNSPAIFVNAGASLQILTGTSSFIVMAGSNDSVASQDTIDSEKSYFVTEDIVDGVDTWTITTSTPLSQSTLTNNSSDIGVNLKFFSAIDTQIDVTQTTVPSYSTYFIPINATYATITESYSNLTIPVTDTASVDIFSNFVINNNSTEIIDIYFYGTVNGNANAFLNDPAFTINTGVSTPIITGSTAISVVVNGTTVISLAQGAISTISSYFVSNINGTWTLTTYLPPSVVSLTNNYSLDATNLIFYSSSGASLSGETSFTAFSSFSMPLIATYATFKDFTSIACTIPLLDTEKPANVFSNYVITNSADQTIGIVYNGTINSFANAQFNSTSIPCLDNLNSPIFTGAETFSIYDSGGILRVDQQTIAANTSYTINGDWSVDPITSVNLTNNFTTANDLMFFNTIGGQVGTTLDTFGAETAATIPSTAVSATLTDTLNGIDTTTLTIPVADSVSSNIFTSSLSTGNLYSITNNATETINIILYGTVNGATDTPLTPVSPTVSILSSQFIPIITGTTTVSIIVGSTTQISHAVISPNTNYYVNDIDGVWTINSYGSIATLTNNYSSSATNLIFYDSTNTQLTTATSLPSLDSQPIPNTPTPATKATLDDLGTTLTVPINNSSANTTVFYTTAIANNSGITVNITFYGTVNGVANTPLNNAPITKTAGASIPIITGATGITVAESGGQINNTTIANPSTQSYYISLVNGVWSLQAYDANAIITNNYNTQGTNLNFYNTGTLLPTIQPTTIAAYGIAGIPSTATSASFSDTFNSVASTLTLPVVDNVSSNIFSAYSVFNKTSSFTIIVNYYGTIDGVPDKPLNDTPLSIPVGGSIPILASTQYFLVYYPSYPTVVIDTRTYISPLPLVASYDINFTSSTWSITPEIFTLTNNSNLTVTTINFYDSNGTLIAPTSYTSIQPWATIPIPTDAVIAIAQYTLPDSSIRNITITLSTQYSSKIFSNNLLINNSRDTVYANFYGTAVTGIQNSLLNDTPILLQAGDRTPIVTSTLNVSVLLDDGFTFISHAPISSTGSYEISPSTGYSIATRAITRTIEQSSSALGIIRFLGGSTVDQPTDPSVNLYAQNANLFAEFLYVSLYLQVISNITTRAAVGVAVNAIINQYGSQYSAQPNFNYIANASLMNPNLLVAEQALTRQYPASATQITKFFLLLQKRINLLAA